MSQTTPTEDQQTTDQSIRSGLKVALVGAIGGTLTGAAITALANAATGVANSISADINSPLTYLLMIGMAVLGFLEGSD
jgi:hypothetical protein